MNVFDTVPIPISLPAELNMGQLDSRIPRETYDIPIRVYANGNSVITTTFSCSTTASTQ